MESIITEIIKSESNIIKREKALVIFLLELIKSLMSLALAKVDDDLVQEFKDQGYQIDRKSEHSINTMLGEVTYKRRRYIYPGKKSATRYPVDELMGWNRYKKYSVLVVKNVAEVSTRMTYRNASMSVELLAP